MQRLWIFLSLLCLATLACATAVTGTPTPFPTVAAVVPLPVANTQPITLTIATLLEAPEAHENNLIRLTGQYQRRPKLVCELDPHPSPATWELASGEDVALAGGFDNELRRLLPDGLTMTVEGHWLHWRGPVGCGKRATVMEIWYLQVIRIVDPSPIARVTLTPFLPGVPVAAGTPGEGTILPTLPQVGLTATLTITGTPITPTLTPEVLLTPTLSETVIPTQPPEEEEPVPPTNTPTLEATAILSPTNTPDAGTATATPENGEPAPSPTPSSTFGPGTPTLTPDPNATATPTPNPNATATSTATPGAGSNIVLKEELETESLNKDTLAPNQIHAWPITLFSTNETVTVTATTADNANLILAIVDEAGTTLVEVNNSGVGGVETIPQFALSAPGPYLVHVKTAAGNPAEYALMLLFEDSLNFLFKPIITYGFEERDIALLSDSEHFWHFAGNQGDNILITADPDDATDVFLELYGPDADLISPSFLSAGDNGFTEQLQWELPEDGLYSIRVGEWNFAAGTYTLTLDD
jgi:hypothetical protein